MPAGLDDPGRTLRTLPMGSLVPPSAAIRHLGLSKYWRCLCREAQQRAKAWVFLLRGRARTEISSQTAKQRRGAADCGQRGEAAGVVAEALGLFGGSNSKAAGCPPHCTVLFGQQRAGCRDGVVISPCPHVGVIGGAQPTSFHCGGFTTTRWPIHAYVFS